MSDLRHRLGRRAALLEEVRDFFRQRGVLEVTTPVLGVAAGTDPAIEPFETRYRGPGFAGGLALYLQTSPEFHMKRLLAAGSGDIYQVMPVFRQGELGRRHNPEFTLLEWYRLGYDHHRLMEEVAELVNRCLGDRRACEKVSYSALFQERFGWNPLTVDVQVLRATAAGHGLDVQGLESRDQWLDLLMSTLIEPDLGQGKLTFVHAYPASQAALARLDPRDPRVACRFELYVDGVELANGFHELADPAEQLARFEADNLERQRKGQRRLPLDRRFIAALEQGLPDCAGVALGLDRLLMLVAGVSNLPEVLSFPLLEA